MALTPGILARGPWSPEHVAVALACDAVRAARRRDAGGRRRDRRAARPRLAGARRLSARLADHREDDAGLALELEPIRWALRLNHGDARQSLSALCVVRSSDGRWLAGRRAGWLATWSGRWALGAAGAVDPGENPADTLGRELREEWSVSAARMTVEALVCLPQQLVILVGLAWLAEGAQVSPDAEHDEFAWWPADVDEWPAEADEPLRRTARMLSGA